MNELTYQGDDYTVDLHMCVYCHYCAKEGKEIRLEFLGDRANVCPFVNQEFIALNMGCPTCGSGYGFTISLEPRS